MFLWLDDRRNLNEHGAIGAVWVKTYEQAVALLVTGAVEVASLDHDLTLSQTLGFTDSERTGYDVLVWMEENNIWPERVLIHSQNASGRIRMLQVV